MRYLIVFGGAYLAALLVRNWLEPYFLKKGEVTNMEIEFSMMAAAVLWLIIGTAWLI